MLNRIFLICWLASVPTVAFAQGTPTKPSSDDEVLLVLPKSFLANRNELADLRTRLDADPENAKLAADVATRYLALGNRSGDPRFYGYARAAINRWWNSDSVSPEVLKIRAKLKEKDHLYDEALADLELVVKQTPRDVQTLIEIGNIYRVQGKYEKALDIADRLGAFAGEIPTALCRAPVMAQTGRAEEAYQLLSKIMPEAKIKFPAAYQWILTSRAEIAGALGLKDDVEQHFTDGLAKDPSDFYLLRGYGDFLLDNDRESEALSILRDHTSDTGVLLRAAIAARKTGDKVLSDKWVNELAARFNEIRLRGGEPHGRFEARFALELQNDPQLALKIAVENWQKQKEIRDTRNVLEAAIAANDVEAVRPVVDFLMDHKTEHVELRKLVQRLESRQ